VLEVLHHFDLRIIIMLLLVTTLVVRTLHVINDIATLPDTILSLQELKWKVLVRQPVYYSINVLINRDFFTATSSSTAPLIHPLAPVNTQSRHDFLTIY
jgi:hypothetical protein